MIVARTARNTVGEPELCDITGRFGADRLEIDRHVARAGIGLRHQDRVRTGSARQVEDLALQLPEHRHDTPAYAHRPTEHRGRKGLRTRGVLAQMDLGLLDGRTRLREVRQTSPCGIDVTIVTDRLRQIGRTTRNQRHLARRGVDIGFALLRQQTLRHARIQQQPHAAFVAARLRDHVRKGRTLRDRGKNPIVNGGKQHRAAIIRTRELDNLLDRLH